MLYSPGLSRGFAPSLVDLDRFCQCHLARAERPRLATRRWTPLARNGTHSLVSRRSGHAPTPPCPAPTRRGGLVLSTATVARATSEAGHKYECAHAKTRHAPAGSLALGALARKRRPAPSYMSRRERVECGCVCVGGGSAVHCDHVGVLLARDEQSARDAVHHRVQVLHVVLDRRAHLWQGQVGHDERGVRRVLPHQAVEGSRGAHLGRQRGLRRLLRFRVRVVAFHLDRLHFLPHEGNGCAVVILGCHRRGPEWSGDDRRVDLGVPAVAPVGAARGQDVVERILGVSQAENLELCGYAHVVQKGGDDGGELLYVVVLVAHDEHAQRAERPLAVLAQDDREQQQQPAVVHDPPDVDGLAVHLGARQDLRLPSLVPPDQDEGHVERVGRREDPHHPLGAGDPLLPRRRPSGHHRVRPEAAQPRRLQQRV
mmetsp:Transcript_29807/g.50923  ORF Transcript_29807/g.50923 Transcript_29807/m.50923 type:complete len:428 (-) Transcript_29807:1470-2753(-)